MSGAGRGEPKGSYQPDGTAAARSYYASEANRAGKSASLADILAEHGYELETRGMPQVDAQGRRVGGRHNGGFGRRGAHWNRERDGGHTGDQGGGGYTSGGAPESDPNWG